MKPNINKTTATRPTEIASMFNTYFASVFTPVNVSNESEESHTDPLLSEVTVSDLKVETLLKNLDINKATGPDEIPCRLLKVIAI